MGFEQELKNSKELEAKALENCNSEPIATPGRVQSYGAVIVFDFKSLVITHVSANTEQLLKLPPKTLLGSSIKNHFSDKDFHAIANIASHQSTLSNREQIKIVSFADLRWDLSLFRSKGLVILELVPVGQPLETLEINSHIKWTLDKIRAATSVQNILTEATKALRNITSFDRVKVLKFHLDDSGEVVAEDKNELMGPYLGLRFPAYDIPPIARQLLLKISIRHVHDTKDEGTPLLSLDNHTDLVDLTYGVLRGNSPIHSQYLRNMDVGAALTLPIVVHDKLWGIFTLHHHKPMALNSTVLYSAELIGKLVSMVIQQKLEQLAKEKMNAMYQDGAEFITLNQNPLYLKSFWENYAPKLMGFIPCDGVAYQIGKNTLVFGSCPTLTTIRKIGQEFAKTEGAIHQTICLDDNVFDGLNDTRGLLLINVHSVAPKINIYFFRNHLKQNIIWAGNPKKDVIIDKENVRLHPRGSFKHFNEINQGKSEQWSLEDTTIATTALDAFKKGLQTEKATSERLKMVVHELNHRMRNILTLVRSMASQTMETDKPITEYVDSLEQRILALAKSNSLLTSSSLGPVDVKSLFLKVVPPLCERPNNLSFEGPQVSLDPYVIPVMVLIIHELGTNALKYGALSSDQGLINVTWSLVDDDLQIAWKERLGPKVSPPDKKGFGTSLIENAIRFEFNGRSNLLFKEEGLEAHFTIPSGLLGAGTKPVFVLEQVQNNLPVQSKANMNVLVLENDYVNAMDIKIMVSKFLTETITVVSNQEQALSSLQQRKYHLAFLDVNLKGESCMAVAKSCKEDKIPFYYVTGYGNSFFGEDDFPAAPVLLKPLNTKEFNTVLSQHCTLKDEG